ncbi:MAG: transketolase [Saprospiraceae bacterium]|nr:transketolase [Saprospiraceae bacterium]MBK7796553.1 transketolase [Saprospiraceae bacterium]MBK8152733.1 transketolase [Saprospiraceae bacterium]MBK9378834.1 transketolase [Saprospiraceae bacterium]MBL0260057.1 transketolase [Saprospiraceae bacterium]
MKSIGELKQIASQVRRDIVRQVWMAKSGHPGGSLGCADFLTALYFRVMNHHPNFNMSGEGEDVFILSNGHISPVFYSVLARSGYFPVTELSTFRKLNSRLQGHPTTHEHLPGVRVSTGSLGQGLSVGLGIAKAKKLKQDKGLVFVLTGDGELQEGQIWEALLSAPHLKLDNIIVTVDWNGQQIDGPTEKVMSLGDLPAKFRAFGWDLLEMNGNDMQEVVTTLESARKLTANGKPLAILMKTIMGYGVDFMMGTHKWHGIAPNDEQCNLALSQLEQTLGDF